MPYVACLLGICALVLLYLIYCGLCLIAEALLELVNKPVPLPPERHQEAERRPRSARIPRERRATEAIGGRAIVKHRQPDGTWQPIGHVDFGDKEDPATWPERLHDELATEGRMIEWPDGEEQEHA